MQGIKKFVPFKAKSNVYYLKIIYDTDLLQCGVLN